MQEVTDQRSYCLRLRKIQQLKEESVVNYISLSSARPTVVGRVITDDVNTKMLSKVTPLMVSRRHASLTIENGKVFVIDHSSLNGVYIKNRRIKPGSKTEVKIGDRIAFGCGIGSGSPEFEYFLEKESHLKTKFIENGSPLKRKRTCEPTSVTIIESNTAQIKEQEQKIIQLAKLLHEKEKLHDNLLNQMQETESDLLTKLENQKYDLQQERMKAELHLQSLLEKQLNEKETQLRSKFDEQIRDLELEKTLVETSLQEELSKKLSEKDEVYQMELEKQKLELANTIASKETEKNKLVHELKLKENIIEKYRSVEANQKELEQCLQELRNEVNEKDNQLKAQKEITKKVESDAKQDVIKTMEEEFTCIICSELFVEATTLPCAHTFCDQCLKSWVKKKKDCPVCRRKIKGKAVRSLVLDSIVEKILESYSEDDRKSRAELCKERKIQKKKDESSEDTEGIRDLFHRIEEDGTLQNDRNNNNAGGHSRAIRRVNENHRRRSRSRSPSSRRQRPRPLPDNGRYNHNNNLYHHQNNNIAMPYMGHVSSNARYHHERDVAGGGGGFHQNYFGHGLHNHLTNHYPNNHNMRCYNCGGFDHIARYCPR